MVSVFELSESEKGSGNTNHVGGGRLLSGVRDMLRPESVVIGEIVG